MKNEGSLIVQRLLKAKHWQLFLVFLSIQLIGLLGILPAFIGEPSFDDYASPLLSSQGQWLFSIATILGAGVLCAWLWSIGRGLQSHLSEELKMNINRFRLSVLTPVVYLVMYESFFIYGINLLNEAALFKFVLPLHVLSILCMFYNLFFVAKTLKTVELQRLVKFSEFLGEFFLVWFFPLGIWLIQPRVNQLVQDKDRV